MATLGREREKRKAVLAVCSASVQHFLVFSLTVLPSYWSPLTLSPAREIYEWLLETRWLGKVSTRAQLMTASPSIFAVRHEINKQTCARKQSRSLALSPIRSQRSRPHINHIAQIKSGNMCYSSKGESKCVIWTLFIKHMTPLLW